MVAQSVECQTCRQEIEHSTPGWARLCSNLGQVIRSYVLVIEEYNLVMHCGNSEK